MIYRVARFYSDVTPQRKNFGTEIIRNPRIDVDGTTFVAVTDVKGVESDAEILTTDKALRLKGYDIVGIRFSALNVFNRGIVEVSGVAV